MFSKYNKNSTFWDAIFEKIFLEKASHGN